MSDYIGFSNKKKDASGDLNSIPTGVIPLPDAYFFVFESIQILSLDSISASVNVTVKNGVTTISWFWSSVTRGHNSDNSDVDNRTSNMNTLLQRWYSTPYKTYLCVRVGVSLSPGSSSGTMKVNSYNIYGYGTIPVPQVQINYPNADSCTIYNKRPIFQMTGTDPSDLRLGYQYRIDNSNNWINVSNDPVNSSTPKEWSLSTDLSTGTHTLEVRAFNENYTYSNTESRTFTYAVPTRVSANTPIQKSQMDTLKTYIDNISNYYGTGSDVTITAPSQYSSLNNTNWDKYREKINKIPSKPGLNSPSKGTAATAAYYNSYITVLENG